MLSIIIVIIIVIIIIVIIIQTEVDILYFTQGRVLVVDALLAGFQELFIYLSHNQPTQQQVLHPWQVVSQHATHSW